MIRAAILAAGNSARAGGVKALFELDGESFLARLVRVFREAAVEDVAVVVGGPHADVIRAAAESLGATIVENRDPSEGPISSVRAAVAALQDPPESSDRLIINPVDIPGIRTATVGALIAAMPPAERPDVWIPSVGGRRGHPVILGPRAIDAVRHLPSGQTLRDVWNDPNLSLEHVSIDDPWCRFDVDTPEDYDRIRNEHGGGE